MKRLMFAAFVLVASLFAFGLGLSLGHPVQASDGASAGVLFEGRQVRKIVCSPAINCNMDNDGILWIEVDKQGNQ